MTDVREELVPEGGGVEREGPVTYGLVLVLGIVRVLLSVEERSCLVGMYGGKSSER